MDLIDMAREFNKRVNQMSTVANISVTEHIKGKTITPTQVIALDTMILDYTELDDTITKGVIAKFNGLIYEYIGDNPYQKSIQPDWTPEGFVSGWKMYHSTDPNYALPYKMRSSIDVYQQGEYMIWTDGLIYKSIINNNSWTPADNPEGWELYSESVEIEEPIEEEPQEPEPIIYPEFKKPASTNPYNKGVIVWYKEKLVRSKIDNNVWAPDEYPQGWELVS